MKYRIKRDPAGFPIETAKYTFWKLSEFLGPQFTEDDWLDDVSKSYCRSRAIILYTLRECDDMSADPLGQLQQACRKYNGRQPKFWPRFLRERYPMAQITDFFSIPYSDLRQEFYEYEQLMTEADENSLATSAVFEPLPHFKKVKECFSELALKMDMNKALIAAESEPPQNAFQQVRQIMKGDV